MRRLILLSIPTFIVVATVAYRCGLQNSPVSNRPDTGQIQEALIEINEIEQSIK